MNERKQHRTIALFLGFFLLLSFFLSSAFAIHEAGHNCSGENCPVCELMNMTEESRHRTLPVSSPRPVSFLHLFHAKEVFFFLSVSFLLHETLVNHKIRKNQ